MKVEAHLTYSTLDQTNEVQNLVKLKNHGTIMHSHFQIYSRITEAKLHSHLLNG